MALNVQKIRDILEKKGIEIYDGLTDKEFEKIENFYSIKFPQVLRCLFKSFLPNLYNWRDFSKENVKKIKDKLNWPIEGIKYDIKYNNFWLECFGEKTGNLEQDLAKAEEYMRNQKNEVVPKLIPIYSHRYVPCYPDSMEVPIFSIYQTDIIIYGNNIEQYFENEFVKFKNSENNDIVHVPFWSEFF